MLGLLPTTLDIRGKQYQIRSDFRNILCVLQAFQDDGLTSGDKLYICLRRIFASPQSIPRQAYGDAYDAAVGFIECGHKGNPNTPRVLNWVKDEQLLFPAVNKVAGTEVRSMPYLHWWTFLGYFQSIDHDDLFSRVLSIRQKRAKGKKLEKWEQEFYKNNRNLCALGEPTRSDDSAKTAKKAAQSIFESLLAEGGD